MNKITITPSKKTEDLYTIGVWYPQPNPLPSIFVAQVCTKPEYTFLAWKSALPTNFDTVDMETKIKEAVLEYVATEVTKC